MTLALLAFPRQIACASSLAATVALGAAVFLQLYAPAPAPGIALFIPLRLR